MAASDVSVRSPFRLACGTFSPSVAVGVGQDVPPVATPREDEHPLTTVRGTDFGRGENRPLRIEPQGREVFQNFSESEADVSSDILEEGQRCICIDEQSSDVRPEVAWVVGSSTLAGVTERLAGIASDHQIDTASDLASWEAGDVRPDRCVSQDARFHRCDQVRD